LIKVVFVHNIGVRGEGCPGVLPALGWRIDVLRPAVTLTRFWVNSVGPNLAWGLSSSPSLAATLPASEQETADLPMLPTMDNARAGHELVLDAARDAVMSGGRTLSPSQGGTSPTWSR
jgi:hypothetical protein